MIRKLDAANVRTTSFRIREDLYEKMKKYSRQYGISITNILERSLPVYMEYSKTQDDYGLRFDKFVVSVNKYYYGKRRVEIPSFREGMIIPKYVKKKKKTVSFRIREVTLAELRRYSDETGFSMTSIVENSIEAFLTIMFV